MSVIKLMGFVHPEVLKILKFDCFGPLKSVVATGVVDLPMPPLFSAFRITVESHYSLAGQALCIMRPC